MRKMAMVIIFVLLFRSIIFADFIDNGDGTVTDTITGLMWQKDTAPGRYSWGEALDYANNLTLAGYSDWRLPNINDLQTLVDYTNTAPAVYPTFVPHTESLRYWSSTPSASNTRMAWVLNTYYGSVHDYGKGWNCYLRAVRAGYKLSENIKVTAPAAGAQWQRGTTQGIQWKSTGAVGDVKIQLKDDSGHYSTIASSISNSGSYNWTIPSNGDIGSGFQIRISDVNHENTIYGFSNRFSLIRGTLSTPISITVPTSSNTGNYTVTWGNSSTSGVTYVLEEATNTAFTNGLRQAYVGPDTNAAINGRTSGNTYYYRVKATKTGYADSAWRTGSNGCTVTSGQINSNLLFNPTAENGIDGWHPHGTVGIAILPNSNPVFYTEDHAKNWAYLFQDVFLPSHQANSYVLLIGYLTAEKVVANSITRHPYLWGYILDNNNQILTYLQGSSMRHIGDAHHWSTCWGIFEIPNGAFSIRFFLKQASQVGDPPDGTRAYYDDLELRIFSTIEEATNFKDNYINDHPIKYITPYTCDTPPSIMVPSNSPTGNYTVSWGSSSTSGVTYVLEEATNTAFTSGLREAYVGPDTSAAITDKSSGNIYYYRVKATKNGYADSGWRTGSNGCTVSFQVGSLKIFIEPQGAVNAGAQWRRTGTNIWFKSGTIESNIPKGQYTVEFNIVPGWRPIENININVIANACTNYTGYYYKQAIVLPGVMLLLDE